MKKLFILFFLLFGVVYGQISTAELPYSWNDERNIIPLSSIPVETMPHLDFEALHKEDNENDGIGPHRFGYSHEVNLTLENSGLWTTTSDGGRLWTLRIYSPDARSINLLYDKFWLPNGAKFFLYSEDKKQHLGAFTSRNNKGTKEEIKGFATTFLFAKTIVLEYYEPANITENGILSVSQVISGYRSIYEGSDSKRDKPNYDIECYLDVNCYPDWHQGTKDAVAFYIYGTYSCSGALLNTTAHDNRPVFLTANHCFQDFVSFEHFVFHWNFEAEIECEGKLYVPDLDPLKTTNGAVILSKREDTDFMLFKLMDDPATNCYVNPYYMGWERTSSSQYDGFCIHHPFDEEKEIVLPKLISLSQHSIGIFPEEICWGFYCKKGISPPNTHWMAVITRGSIHGGSSGAPLLNDHNRVIGQLHGGEQPFCPPVPGGFVTVAFFGCLDFSWEGRDATERLSDWLDPVGTDAMFIDGMPLCRKEFTNQTISSNVDIAGCGVLHVQDIAIIRNAKVNVTATQEITINDAFHAEAGTTVSFSITPNKQNTDNSPNVVIEETEVITESFPNNAMRGNNLTETRHQFNLHPNPNPGTFQIETNFPVSEISQLKITNTLGLTVYETKNLASNEIQLTNLVSGPYFVVMVLKDGTVLTQKMMVQR